MIWRKQRELREEAERLRKENEALREQLFLERRRARQWANLFSYNGAPQPDNLNGGEAPGAPENGPAECIGGVGWGKERL